MKNLLTKLHIEAVNPGACIGAGEWLADPAGRRLVSTNPTTGAPIAEVVQATDALYERVIDGASQAFETWRTIPAPKRGLLIRDLGAALRELGEPLGDLVTLEMGKIRAEGIGEVQEIIDICDFAVGLSRQLYGLTMHSERPAHRMYEQWHPVGVVGVITRLLRSSEQLMVVQQLVRAPYKHKKPAETGTFFDAMFARQNQTVDCRAFRPAAFLRLQ